MERRMVKKKGRARERQRKVQSQGEGDTRGDLEISGGSWGLRTSPTLGSVSRTHTHTHTYTHTTSCGDSPSVFSILVHFLFSEYLLLGDTVLRTSRLIL